jgi:membrane-associated phospholipid phosphatase
MIPLHSISRTACLASIIVFSGAALAQEAIEPGAGAWRTWLLASGAELRAPPPPDRAATEAELTELRAMAAQRQGTQAQIVYWDVGGPSYRWNEIAAGEAVRRGLATGAANRNLALLNAALYDAVIAAWDSKYAHNRPRPAVADPGLSTALPTPNSPAYPSEHAAAAGAAAEVLAYLFPDRIEAFRAMAQEAAESRLRAGLQYRSDVTAGLALGRAVAARAIERGRGDGSDAVWTGSVPTGPGRWQGTNPITPLAGTWRSWTLARGDEFRPPAPPAHDSQQLAAEVAELRGLQRTPVMTGAAMFWEVAVGGGRSYAYWNEVARRMILEHRLDASPPRAARVLAVTTIALNDAYIACWDAKYTYWAIRPSQLEPQIRPLFPPPNHPSYPSAHSCLSAAVTGVLTAMFPDNAAAFEAMRAEAGEARIWAGIHYRSDIVAGSEIGRRVAERVAAAALEGRR